MTRDWSSDVCSSDLFVFVGGQAYQEGWMLIPSYGVANNKNKPSLSRRVNANSQPGNKVDMLIDKLIKKGEC